MGDKQSLLYSLDRRDIDENKIELIGWCISKTTPVSIELLDSKGQAVPMNYKVMTRPDASLTMLGDESQKECGFRVSFSYQIHETYRLILKNSEDKKVFELNAKKMKAQVEKEQNRKYQPLGRILKHLSKRQILHDGKVLLTKGPVALSKEWTARYATPTYAYEKWFAQHKITKAEQQKQREMHFPHEPKISIIVPAFRTPELFLRQMVQSVLDQTYSNWELCIADGGVEDTVVEETIREYQKQDDRIRYVKLPENRQISGNSNAALALATGEYAALLDHDDLYTPDALFEVVKAINEKNADVIYTDEDKISMDLQHHFEPHFKPDLNMDLLRSNNYICHLFVTKIEYLRDTGGFRSAFDGAQDFDLIFRCVEQAKCVYHIPKILYHWRMHQNSTAANPESKMYCYEAGKHAIEEHLKRVGQEGKVYMMDHLGYYRVEYPVIENHKITALIMSNGNNTDDIRTKENLLQFGDGLIETILICKVQSAKEINEVIKKTQSAFILMVQSGMKLQDKHAVSRWLGACEREEVGIVSAKVYNSVGQIWQCGQIFTRSGNIISLFQGCPKGEIGYFTRAKVQQDLSVVALTASMIKKSALEVVDGCEDTFNDSYCDSDLCFRMQDAGYKVVLSPDICINQDKDPINPRFTASGHLQFVQTWKKRIELGDPNYNHNLNEEVGNFTVY